MQSLLTSLPKKGENVINPPMVVEVSKLDADEDNGNLYEGAEDTEDAEDVEDTEDDTEEDDDEEDSVGEEDVGVGEDDVPQLTKKNKSIGTKNITSAYRKPNTSSEYTNMGNMGNMGYNAQTSELIKNIDSSLNDDSDTDYPDDKYLEKFSESMKTNYIAENHPETITHNYNEVKKMSEIVIDSNGIIIDDNHRTIPFITKYEKTRILGQRAKQIDSGAMPFVMVPPNIIDGYQIALIELREKKIPFIIKRPLPCSGGVEYWKVSDLIVL